MVKIPLRDESHRVISGVARNLSALEARASQNRLEISHAGKYIEYRRTPKQANDFSAELPRRYSNLIIMLQQTNSIYVHSTRCTYNIYVTALRTECRYSRVSVTKTGNTVRRPSGSIHPISDSIRSSLPTIKAGDLSILRAT